MTQEQFDTKLFTLEEELNDANLEVETLKDKIESLWQEEIECEDGTIEAKKIK